MVPEQMCTTIFLVFSRLIRSLRRMKRSAIALLCLGPALIVAAPPVNAESASLRLSADTPTADVVPRNRERGPFALPELEFRFQIEARCGVGQTPKSLSLAVADTRRTFTTGQIESGELGNVPLRIPARQIAPVVIADFCVAGNTEEASTSAVASRTTLTISAALTAQASFLCEGDTARSMTYANAPLDVLLVCAEQNVNDPEAPAE